MSDFTNKANEFVADVNALNKFVNGDTGTVVTLPNGQSVPSMRKMANDAVSYLNDPGNHYTKAEMPGVIYTEVRDHVMSKTFYVDAVNGNDNNDGSSGSPFKTIKKAIDIAPTGGYIKIYLNGNSDKSNPSIYKVSEINLYNKLIYFLAWGDTHSVISPTVSIINNYNVTTGQFNLHNSEIFIQGDNDWAGSIYVENPQKVDNSVGWAADWKNGTFCAKTGHSSVYVRSFSGGIKLYDSSAPLCKLHYADSRTLFTLALTNAHLTIENTNVKLITTTGGGIYGFTTNADVKITDLLGNDITANVSLANLFTVVRDANGIPRNVISNIIL